MKPLTRWAWKFALRHPVLTAKSYWKWRGYLWRHLTGRNRLPRLDVPPGDDPRKHMPPVDWKVRAEGEAKTLRRLGIDPDESLR